MPLLDLPEEILFLILESAILPSEPRLSLPEPQSLLTCRTIHRVGLPVLYQSILLKSVSQAESVESTILSQPKLVRHIRHLYSLPLISWLPVFRAIGDAKGSLDTLDFVFHVSLGRSQFLFDWENVGPTVSAVPVRRLVVRQGQGFLQDRALIASSALARAVEGWPSLVRCAKPRPIRDMLIIIKQQEIAIIGPRLLFAPLPLNQPSPLALALSRSPSLRVLRTPLPWIWDPSLLVVSENPNLVRIVFTGPRLSSSPSGVVATDVAVSIEALLARYDDHPWLVEAQKHPRLMRLIGAKQGTDDDM